MNLKYLLLAPFLLGASFLFSQGSISGNAESTFQYLNFQTASQPYYVTISNQLEILNEAKQYTSTDEYYTWLIESLKKESN